METELIGEGKFIRLVRLGKWEFAERTKANGVVVVVPQLSDGRWLLIEQRREAVRSSCIEFPAGLSGDSTEKPDEMLETAALRELVEETGYEATEITLLGRAAPTPGLTSEIMTFFSASGLKQVSSGGGVGGEQIATHLVEDSKIDEWLKNRSKDSIVSAMVYSGLYLARTRLTRTS